MQKFNRDIYRPSNRIGPTIGSIFDLLNHISVDRIYWRLKMCSPVFIEAFVFIIELTNSQYSKLNQLVSNNNKYLVKDEWPISKCSYKRLWGHLIGSFMTHVMEQIRWNDFKMNLIHTLISCTEILLSFLSLYHGGLVFQIFL